MGRRKRADRQATFAEIVETAVAADPGPHGEPLVFPCPLGDGHYEDGHGVQWRLRGGALKVSRVEHLMRDPSVRVLHQYLSEIRDVPLADRPALMTKIRPYLKGAEEPSPGDRTDFCVGEFKDDQHRSLLIIEDRC
ncbi:hypothetical protein [Actinopolymorpha pittospori]